MATLSIKDNQLFQIKAHMAMLGLKKYHEWIDYILEHNGVKGEDKEPKIRSRIFFPEKPFKGVLKDNGVKGRNNEEH